MGRITRKQMRQLKSLVSDAAGMKRVMALRKELIDTPKEDKAEKSLKDESALMDG